MSLTAHLLFQRPTQLPTGRVTMHNSDTRRQPLSTGQLDYAARNTATRFANIERVYNMIYTSRLKVTTLDIEIATGLSRSTVRAACEELEQWKGGQRIIRHRGKQHAFEAVK